MTKSSRGLLSIFTILYFLLGFVNIHFSFLALGCMIIPFILLLRKRKNNWCSGICPRADYLSLFRFVNFRLKAPKWLFGNNMKNNILVYFCINILFITMSTFMVRAGRMLPIDKIRLFIAFQLPIDLPQIIPTSLDSPVLLHLAFRLYSLMLSSTLLGTFLAIVFKPKTWCVICPVKTISHRYLNSIKQPS